MVLLSPFTWLYISAYLYGSASGIFVDSQEMRKKKVNSEKKILLYLSNIFQHNEYYKSWKLCPQGITRQYKTQTQIMQIKVKKVQGA